MVSAILATLLVFVSVAVLLFIVSLLFNAVHFPLGRVIERQRFARAQARGRRGDEYLEHGDIGRALEQFRSAFYLELITSDRRLLTDVNHHHTGLLSRFIAVTEEIQGGSLRLMSLAKVDRLISERGDLQRRYLTQRDRGGRDGHLQDLYTKLRENGRELRVCLKQLVAEITASQVAERYH